MKTSNLLQAVSLFGMLGAAADARAQGPLAPPGAPAPAMRTLAQVEPRFPVSSAPVTLSRPGSYYLTTNLSDTVTISADNVTLDLMGFTVAPPAGNNGIALSGAGRNLRLHNGVVALTGTDSSGVSTAGVSGNLNGLIEAVRVAGGGRYGITIGAGCTVQDCQVTGADTGIRIAGNSVVRACRFEGNVTGMRLTGTGALVEDNIVRGNTNNYNIAAGNRLNLLLCEVPETLAWPCSVKLAGTLTCTQAGVNGITVNADGVTIDLAGHALIGPGETSGCGVYQDASFQGLRVVNGMVREWRGSSMGGIDAMGDSAMIENVHAVSNYFGIHTGAASVVDACTAAGNAASGFAAGSASVLSYCTSVDNASLGYDVMYEGVAVQCVARNNAKDGFSATAGKCDSCVAFSNGESGFRVSHGTVVGCEASYNTYDGFFVVTNSSVLQCIGRYNGRNGDGAGIHVVNSGSRVEQSLVMQNDRGIDVDKPANYIVRNVASANTVNWSVVSGNVCYVVNAVASGAISGDSGGTSPGSTDPNANFTY